MATPPPSPVESSARIGPYVETVRLDRSTLTVSYSGPPIPQDVRDKLAKWWADRIERLTWQMMGLSDPSKDGPWNRRFPEAPDKARKPSEMAVGWGSLFRVTT